MELFLIEFIASNNLKVVCRSRTTILNFVWWLPSVFVKKNIQFSNDDTSGDICVDD